MAAVNMPSKKAVAVKAAKLAVKNPRLARRCVKIAIKVGKPIAKRRARKKIEVLTVSLATSIERLADSVGTSVERVADSVGTTAELVTIYAPMVALALGLAEPPKRRSMVAPIAAGALIGAAAVYLFGPRRSTG